MPRSLTSSVPKQTEHDRRSDPDDRVGRVPLETRPVLFARTRFTRFADPLRSFGKVAADKPVMRSFSLPPGPSVSRARYLLADISPISPQSPRGSSIRVSLLPVLYTETSGSSIGGRDIARSIVAVHARLFVRSIHRSRTFVFVQAR